MSNEIVESVETTNALSNTLRSSLDEQKAFQTNQTIKEIHLLREWKEFTKKYEWLHFKSYTYFKYINYGLMIPIIILTSVSGSANIILSSVSSDDCNTKGVDHPQLIVGFTTIIAAIMTTIYNFMKVPEFQQRHLTHSSDFNKLSREIEMELVLFETKYKTYTSLEEFIKMMRTRLDRFIENAPPIPNKVLKELCHFKNYKECAEMVQSLDASLGTNLPSLPTTTDHLKSNNTTSNHPSSTSDQKEDGDDACIQIVEEDARNVVPPRELLTEHSISTNDAIKNIEELKLQRMSNEFERFKHNIIVRSNVM